MLWGDFHVSGDVGFADGFEVGVAFGVFGNQVIANAGADEDVFDFGDFLDFRKQGKLACGAVLKRGASDAGFVFAGTVFFPFGAVCAVHVGRGTADIGDGASEFRHFCHAFCFAEDGFFAAGDNLFSLMVGDGAE